MNTCAACRQPVKRYNAVIRGDAYVQHSWHPACFTVARAVVGVEDAPVALSLSARLAAAGVTR